jgi:hypothetical protein
MCAHHADRNPGLIASVLTNKCPRCRRGNLFTFANPYKLKTTMRMPELCSECGQPFELETGFYFGTGYVSYGLSVFITGLCFIAWYFLVGISIYDNSIFWWLGCNSLLLVILQPVLQRLARSIWITFFVRYNPNWRSEPAESRTHQVKQ